VIQSWTVASRSSMDSLVAPANAASTRASCPAAGQPAESLPVAGAFAIPEGVGQAQLRNPARVGSQQVMQMPDGSLGVQAAPGAQEGI